MIVILVLVAGFSGFASADSGIEAWRSEVTQVRMLAENDIPAAYKQARHLQATLPANTTPEDKARLLNLLARVEMYQGDIEAADLHAAEAFQLAKAHGDKVGQAESDLVVALNAVNQGRIDKMIAAVTHVMTILEGVNRPDLLGEAMLRTSMMYRRQEQFDDSMNMAMQALETAGRNNNAIALAYACQGVAMAYDASGRAAEAKEYFVRMLAYARAAHSGLLEADAKAGLAGTVLTLGDPADNERMVREAIAQYRQIGGVLYAARTYSLLADSMRKQGRLADAIAALDQSIEIYGRYRIKIGLWWGHHIRSGDWRALGNIARAETDATRAYALAQEIGFPLYLRESARRLAEIAAAHGDYKRAYQLSVEATEMAERVTREKIGQRMVELAKRYADESKRRQIDELTRHNEQQAVEIKQRTLQQRWLWTLLFSGGVVFGTTVFFMLRLRRSREEIRLLNVGLEQRVQVRTAELRQQTRYLRTLIDMLPVMAWLKDTNSRFLAVNRAVAETAGQPADAMIGKTDLDFFPEKMAEAYLADDAVVMASRQDKIIEEQIAGVNGTVWIETYKAPVLDEDGTVLGTVGVARDITESRAVTAAHEAALAEAQRLARMRSEFMAQISHELRTPLNGILGYAQVLRRNKHLDERQIAGLTVIQQSGEHLLTLINDILDSAKIESGKQELSLSEIPLRHFLSTIAEIITVKADIKNLYFVCDFAADLPDVVRADEKRLRQVLLNLLANAVKFTDHGQVSLHVSFQAPSTLSFEVRDNGIGIAESDLDKIFEPFEQAGEVQRRLGGTGLGLAISRQFVRLMGGDIQVESQPGQGSVFRFALDLPVVDREIEVVPVMVINGYRGARQKILVVDDVAENRAVLLDMLQPLGFEIFEAANGHEAIEKTQSLQPDLILMDVFMPEMDGLTAIQRLRQLPGWAEVPIITISASASGSDEETCMAAGADAFLPKPVDMDRLLQQVAQLLKLDWICEPPEPGRTQPRTSAAPMTIPPQEEMETLHRMALHGNMRDIVQMATHLTELDVRYRAFADQLLLLARSYQSKTILSFVERYLDQNHRHD